MKDLVNFYFFFTHSSFIFLFHINVKGVNKVDIKSKRGEASAGSAIFSYIDIITTVTFSKNVIL